MAVKVPASGEAAKFLAELRNSGSTLDVLVIGETGSGKTTLIDNLQLTSEETATFVTVYDTSGLETARAAWEKIRNGEAKKWVVIFCIPLTETRMRASLIRTFHDYHDLGINWNKTVFALTFADSIPIPKSMKRDSTFTPTRFFEQRWKEWVKQIRKVFREQICGSAIDTAKMFPTTGDSGDKLPNDEEWLDSAWSSIAITASSPETIPLPQATQTPLRKSYFWLTIIVISTLACSFLGLHVGGSLGTAFGATGRSKGINIGAPVGAVLGMLVGGMLGCGGAVAFYGYIKRRRLQDGLNTALIQ